MTMFNVDDLNNIEITGVLDTTLPPVPIGEWPAYIKAIKGRAGTSDKGNDYAILDVTWAITDPSVAEEVGMDEPTVRQSIFLDVDENGQLELGPKKNIQLGRLREALGQNDGRPWNFGMLENSQGIVKVSHRIHKGQVYADVAGVVAPE